MNNDQLETILREKIETETPRPGFETRIQAMAREQAAPKKRSIAWLAAPGLAAAVIGVMMLKNDREPTIVSVPKVEPSEVTKAVNQSPMHREMNGMKTDARRAFSFLTSKMPSLTKAQ